MNVSLIHNAASKTTVKANLPTWSNYLGCEVHSLDSAPNDLTMCRFIPLDFEGNPTRVPDAGYSIAFIWRNTDTNIFPRLDGEVNIPIEGYLNFDELKASTEKNSTLFFNEVSENEIKEILKLSAEQTGDCRSETAKFYGFGFYPVVEGNYQVVEGDYIIIK